MDLNATFGTQLGGLYRRVVSGYKWSLRQVSLAVHNIILSYLPLVRDYLYIYI